MVTAVAGLYHAHALVIAILLFSPQPAPVHVPVVPPIQVETVKQTDGAAAIISERKKPECTLKVASFQGLLTPAFVASGSDKCWGEKA